MCSSLSYPRHLILQLPISINNHFKSHRQTTQFQIFKNQYFDDIKLAMQFQDPLGV